MEYSNDINSELEHISLLEKEVKRLKSISRKKQIDYLKNNYKAIIKKRMYIILLIVILMSATLAPYTIVPSNQTYTFVKHVSMISDSSVKSHEKFLTLLGKTESGNNYKCINSRGYCGKYQMGRSALIEIGLDKITQEDFLAMPALQEIAMKLLLRKNKQFLQSHIGKYNSKTIKGIYITESGLLAGAHLGGASSVMEWLESNGANDFRDGNGTPISRYIQMFSGYNLNL